MICAIKSPFWNWVLGFAGGFALGLALMTNLWSHSLRSQIVQDKASLKTTEETTAALKDVTKAVNDTFSAITVVYEPPDFSIPVAISGCRGELFPIPAMDPVRRWIIPAKVRPIVIGESNGASYSWFDGKRETPRMPALTKPESPALK